MTSTVRRLTYFIFAYTCIEGLIVNITYPNPLAFIVKDIVIAMLYLSLLTGQGTGSGTLGKLGGALGAFAFVMCFYMFMPTRVSLLSQAVGLKQKLFYIPLMYVAYAFVRDEQDLYRLIKLMAWTVIPTSVFGIYLYFAGPAALRALGAGYSSVVVSTAGAAGINFWRVPGTFTSPGQFSLYLLVNAALLSGLRMVPGAPKRQKMLSIVALVVTLGALLVSGSRSPLVFYFLCTGLTLFYMGKLSRIGIAALGAYTVMAVGFAYFGAGVQDRVGSIVSYDNVERFQTTYFGQMFIPHLLASPMGLGLGVATIGARHFTEWNNVVLVESYLSIIVYETGFIGLIVWLWATVRLVSVLVGCWRTMSTASWRALWYTMVLLVFVLISVTPVNTVLDSAPGNMYFWFFIGAAVRLSDVNRLRAWQQVSVSGPSPYGAVYGQGAAR